MLVSPHVTDVKDMANHWNTQLQETKQILETWMSAQQQVPLFFSHLLYN